MQLQPHINFGPVVKPLGIAMKKEGGKVFETTAVVRSQATRENKKGGKCPGAQNSPPKMGP